MASSIPISCLWRKLSGEENWEDLLHPLDLNLRRYLIHYIQRQDAAVAPFCKGHLTQYPPDEYFTRSGLEIGNPYKYQVTNFIYAAADKDPIFFGYVAVATNEGKAVLGRRDILISWRGTITESEKERDKQFLPTSAKEIFGTDDIKVHRGFYSIYTSARDKVLKMVKDQVEKYQNEDDVSITVVGHSLGAALATLTAMDIAHNDYNKPTGKSGEPFLVTAFPIAGPRVGDINFKDIYDKELMPNKRLHILRIEQSSDIAPFLPPWYKHVGEKLTIDPKESPYLKKFDVKDIINNLALAHNVHVYMHGVAGVQENGEFKLEEDLDFDNAVVNKYSDFLIDELKIPTEWWDNDKFKGMVQKDGGHWKLGHSAFVPDPPSA